MPCHVCRRIGFQPVRTGSKPILRHIKGAVTGRVLVVLTSAALQDETIFLSAFLGLKILGPIRTGQPVTDFQRIAVQFVNALRGLAGVRPSATVMSISAGFFDASSL